jgi:hypothetical protein
MSKLMIVVEFMMIAFGLVIMALGWLRARTRTAIDTISEQEMYKKLESFTSEKVNKSVTLADAFLAKQHEKRALKKNAETIDMK